MRPLTLACRSCTIFSTSTPSSVLWAALAGMRMACLEVCTTGVTRTLRSGLDTWQKLLAIQGTWAGRMAIERPAKACLATADALLVLDADILMLVSCMVAAI